MTDSLPICIPNVPLPAGFSPPPVDDDGMKAFDRMMALIGEEPAERGSLAVLRQKYWGSKGVNLTVQFLDSPDAATRKLIMDHANLWGKHSNVKFRETASQGQVRIARKRGDGYWSYLGRDVLGIPRNQPTMNLDSFTSRTSAREFMRIVPHEFGHTLGFPHEHTRKGIISRLDPQKVYALFQRTQGWSRQMIDEQILKPLNEAELIATRYAREDSIMCYEFPGSVTRDGKPIVGGSTISQLDYDLARKIYPILA